MRRLWPEHQTTQGFRATMRRLTMGIVILDTTSNDICSVYLGPSRQQAADGQHGHPTMLGEGCTILMDDELHGVLERSRRSPA